MGIALCLQTPRDPLKVKDLINDQVSLGRRQGCISRKKKPIWYIVAKPRRTDESVILWIYRSFIHITVPTLAPKGTSEINAMETRQIYIFRTQMGIEKSIHDNVYVFSKRKGVVTEFKLLELLKLN